jgi:acetoin utilization deacetylase AcuC-like enzyme
MIIIAPPPPLPGSPNLSKGAAVFNQVLNPHEDIVVRMSQDDLIFACMQIAKTHDTRWVDRVISGSSPNGYGQGAQENTWRSQNSHSTMSVAGMILAATNAVLDDKPIVFAPLSGFHHAGYATCGGYCTFNGLVAAADAIKSLRKNARVLIIDGDGHQGDGTIDLISRGRQEWLVNVDLSSTVSATEAEMMIEKAINKGPWDLVIYQAGADAHIEDPYGSGYLDDEEWTIRDTLVFNLCFSHHIPCVFTLAGGYNGLKTLDLHRRTFASALQVYEPGSVRLVCAPVRLSGKADSQDPEQ